MNRVSVEVRGFLLFLVLYLAFPLGGAGIIGRVCQVDRHRRGHVGGMGRMPSV